MDYSNNNCNNIENNISNNTLGSMSRSLNGITNSREISSTNNDSNGNGLGGESMSTLLNSIHRCGNDGISTTDSNNNYTTRGGMSRSLNGIINSRGGMAAIFSSNDMDDTEAAIPKAAISQSLQGMLCNNRRIKSITNINKTIRLGFPRSYDGVVADRGMMPSSSIHNLDLLRGVSQPLNDKRGLTRSRSHNLGIHNSRGGMVFFKNNDIDDTEQDLATIQLQPLNDHIRCNNRGITRSKSNDLATVRLQSLNNIRDKRGLTRSRSHDLALMQLHRQARIQVSSYIDNNMSNNTIKSNASLMSKSLNGIRRKNQDNGFGSKPQRRKHRPLDGMSQSLNGIRCRGINNGISQSLNGIRSITNSSSDNGMMRRGGMVLLDDNYVDKKNSNALEENAAIQPCHDALGKVSSSSYGNNNNRDLDQRYFVANSQMQTTYSTGLLDQVSNMANLPDRYKDDVGICAQQEKEDIQENSHKQQDQLQQQKTISESMKLLMESMKRSAMSRKIIKQFSNPFKSPKTTLFSDCTKVSTSSNSSASYYESAEFVSNTQRRQRPVLSLYSKSAEFITHKQTAMKAKRKLMRPRSKHIKPTSAVLSRRQSIRKSDIHCNDSPSSTSRTSDGLLYDKSPSDVFSSLLSSSNDINHDINYNKYSVSKNNNSGYGDNDNANDDENSILMESSLCPTIQAHDEYSSVYRRDNPHNNHIDNAYVNHNNKINADVDFDDNFSLAPTVVSQLSFMNQPINSYDINAILSINANDKDTDNNDADSVVSSSSNNSWLWRIA